MDLAVKAAENAGTRSLSVVGGDAHQLSRSDFGTFTGGATYGAFAACTGGGDVEMELAGEAYVLDCDGTGHRVASVVLPSDTVTFRVTRPNDVPSVWGASLTPD